MHPSHPSLSSLLSHPFSGPAATQHCAEPHVWLGACNIAFWAPSTARRFWQAHPLPSSPTFIPSSSPFHLAALHGLAFVAAGARQFGGRPAGGDSLRLSPRPSLGTPARHCTMEQRGAWNFTASLPLNGPLTDCCPVLVCSIPAIFSLALSPLPPLFFSLSSNIPQDGFDFPLQTLHEDRASGLDTDSLGSAAVAHLPPGSSHSLLGRRKADHSALGSATGAGPGGGASSVWSLDAEDAAGLFASGFSGSLLGAPGSSAAAAGRRLQHFESQLTGHFQHPPRRALSETFLPGLGSQASGDPWASSTSHLDEGLENLHLDAGFPEVPDVERLLSTSDVSSPASGPARLSHQNDLGTHNQQQEHHLQEAQRRQQQQHQQKHQQQHHQAQHHYQQQSGQPPSSPKNDRHDQSEAEGELQPHHNQMLMHQRPDGSRVSSSRNTTPPPVLAGPGEPAAEPRSRLFHPRPLHPESYQDVPQHATPSMSSGWSAANTHGRESAPAVPVYLQEAYGSFQQPPSSAAGMPRDARHNPMSPFRRSNSAVGTSGFAEHRQAGNGKMNRCVGSCAVCGCMRRGEKSFFCFDFCSLYPGMLSNAHSPCASSTSFFTVSISLSLVPTTIIMDAVSIFTTAAWAIR